MSRGIEWAMVDSASQFAGHLGAVEDLFEEVFHRKFPLAEWNQFYLENPYGNPLVSLAYSGSTLVAHQALVPAVASDGNADIRYHLSMSTMVHPAHRSFQVFLQLFENVHRHASGQGTAFVLGFPNANLYALLRRCFGYKTIIESPLRNWVPPIVSPGAISVDGTLGWPRARGFSPPSTSEYWTWRTKLNLARAAVVNDRLRIIYKLLAGGALNVLNVERRDLDATWLDLAGLAAAEGCRNVRITDYHASVLGIAASELKSHEGYCVRMNALPLCQPVPELQFNLLFCDIF